MNPTTLPSFLLNAYTEGKRSGTITAWTVCVDISGFTAMTEALMAQGHAGAEAVSDNLNALFGPLVTEVYQMGGYIPYFAGDAFTAIYDASTCTADDILQLASRMQFWVRNAVNDHAFNVKIGLAFGEINWGLLAQGETLTYFRGEAIDDSANAQVAAKSGQVIAASAFYEIAKLSKTWRKLPSGFYRLSEEQDLNELSLPILDKSAYLPKQGEFRQVTSVFLSFEGVPNHDDLDKIVSDVFEKANRYAGYFKEVDFGDKGSMMVCLFGAPVSYEDSANRALEFALSVREDFFLLRRQFPELKCKIGISSGMAFCGLVGAAVRHQYAAVGTLVNLAARLVARANWSEILTDDALARLRAFRFHFEGRISYKGLLSNMATWRLEGLNTEEHLIFQGAMAGRQVQLQQLSALAESAFSSKKLKIAVLVGEAGIGKSRMTFELEQLLKPNSNPQWCSCQSDKVLPRPFLNFAFFFRHFFEQSAERSIDSNKAAFDRRFGDLRQYFEMGSSYLPSDTNMELHRLQPAIENLCGLYVNDENWLTLDGKARYELTLEAIVHTIGLTSAIQPVVIELEDARWLDQASLEAIMRIRQLLANTPVFMVANIRPLDDGSLPLWISEVFGENVLKIEIQALELADIEQLAAERLGAPVHENLVEALQKASGGNPFHMEQLLAYWSENQLIEQKLKRWQVGNKPLRLSDSLQTVLTARLDRLSALVRETVKTAAVIGREFETPVLNEIMRQQNLLKTDEEQNLMQQMVTAEEAQIWRSLNEIRYIFQQALLHEAVYDMQLRSRLRSLHQTTAEAIELIYATQLDAHFDELAHHYEKAGLKDKAFEYLFKAANYARLEYQNEHALQLYDKILTQYLSLDDRRRQQVLIYRASILELLGQWDEAGAHYEEAANFPPEQSEIKYINRAISGKGFIALLQGNYAEAKPLLDQAAALFETSNDTFGLFKVYAHLGNLHFRTGKYEKAKEYYQSSLVQGSDFRNSSTAAEAAAYLGLTFMNLGQYDMALKTMLEQLHFCEQAKNRQGMASLHTNLGILYSDIENEEAALMHLSAGKSLSEQLGDKRLLSINLGCLGDYYQHMGDFATASQMLNEDLRLCTEMGDPQGLAICYNLLGSLAAKQGKMETSLELHRKALKKCKKLGYAKGVAKARSEIAATYLLFNKPNKAFRQYQKAVEACRALGHKPLLLTCLLESALCLLELDLPEAAAVLVLEVEQLKHILNRPSLQFKFNWSKAWLADAEQWKVTHLPQIHTENDQRAADIAWSVFCVDPSDAHRMQAHAAQTLAFSQRPSHVYTRRLQALG